MSSDKAYNISVIRKRLQRDLHIKIKRANSSWCITILLNLKEGFTMKNLFPVVSAHDFLSPDNLFDAFFNNLMPSQNGAFAVPKVDIEDKGKEYVLKADLPGVAKEDVNVTYDNDVLTVSAQHEEQKDEKDEKHNYIRKERVSSSFCRQFAVRNIRKDDIQASFKDGVLEVVLPKADMKQIEASHRIAIK